MQLSKNSDIVIVLPSDPLATERFAAEELAKYLKASLGAVAKITHSKDENAYSFIIGSTSEVAGPEGLYVCIGEKECILAGSDDDDGYNRGTLYAVYEFLERYVGCCFGAYSKEGVAAGEMVAHHESLELLTEVCRKESADLPYRTAIVQYDAWVGNADHKLSLAFIDWLAKNRYNRILTWVGIYDQFKALGYIPELEKRGIRLSVGHHHAVATWLPPFGSELYPTKYAEEHPEFYRMLEDGSRFTPTDPKDFNGQLIFCNRNEELIDEVVNNISLWLSQNPLVDTIAFWPNDGKKPQCCCEKCAPYSKTENYLYFENELAKRLRVKHPDVKIDALIYMDLWDCPENMELCDGIQIDESTWAADGIRTCGKPDGSSVIGTKFEKNLLDYRQKCKNTVFYEYYMGNYANRQRVLPAADELQSLYQHYKKVGFSGSGTQIECFNLWNNLQNFYGFARVAYDTSLSFEKQLENMCRLYGKGAETMAEIFRIYEQTMDGQVSIIYSGDFFTGNVDKKRVYDLFEKALSAADTSTARNNIRLSRMAFRYTDIAPRSDGEKEKAEDALELDYMFTHFNSYLSGDGYGIAIPKRQITDYICNDKWYQFD